MSRNLFLGGAEMVWAEVSRGRDGLGPKCPVTITVEGGRGNN